jgi:hypothetical protein
MMKKIELILDLERDGKLIELFRGGFISWKLMRDKDIFLTFDAKVKQGMKQSKAINETSIQFDIDALMVRRAIKSFR